MGQNRQQSAGAGFDPALARLLADYSQLVYKGKAAGVGVFYDSYRTGAGVLVVELPDYIVIACRGTQSPKDWIQDAKFTKISPFWNPSIRVHDGFYNDVASVIGRVVDRIGLTKDKPILITGHSKGGGEASIFAFKLAKAYGTNRIKAIYTFASPRVGNAIWRYYYDEMTPLRSKTFRVVAAGDLVPHLPGLFTTPFDGYRHVGQEIFLAGPGRWLENPVRGFEIIANDWRVAKAIERGDFDFITRLHSITDDYIPLLK